MKKLINLGLALVLGLSLTACSSDDDDNQYSILFPYSDVDVRSTITGAEVVSEGGTGYVRFNGCHWDSVCSAKSYLAPFTSESSTITDLEIERHGDTIFCECAKIYKTQKEGWTDCMAIEVAPNETGKDRYIHLEIVVTEPEYIHNGKKYKAKQSVQDIPVVFQKARQ